MEPAPREVTIPFRRLSRWLDGFADRHGEVETIVSPLVVELMAADGARAWIAVPFPPLQGTLLSHIHAPRRFGVLLVRRGGHAAGVFDGERLVASKVGSSYVQGSTKAGGWSQQRYARRRANQAVAAFAAAADDGAGVLTGQPLDAVFVGGDRAAVTAVLADPRLASLSELVTEPWLNVPDPRLRVLEGTPEQFAAVRIKLLP